MTESEWLTSDDPAAMLAFLQHGKGTERPWDNWDRISDRKLRLFACACCRAVWHRLTNDAPCGKCRGAGYRVKDKHGHDYEIRCRGCKGTGRVNRSRKAVEVAERFADGEATAEELAEAGRGASQALGTQWALATPPTADCPANAAAWCAYANPDDSASASGAAANAADFTRGVVTPAAQAALLRCVVGNPFRPVTLPPGPSVVCGLCKGEKIRKVRPTGASSRKKYVTACFCCRGKGAIAGPCPWLTPQVVSLAQAAYDDRPGRECQECWDGVVLSKRRTKPDKEKCPHCGGTGRIDDGTLDPVRLSILADALELEAGCEGERCRECHGSGTYTVQVRNAAVSAMNGYGAATTYSEWRGCRHCGGDHDRKGTGRIPHPIIEHLRSSGPHVRGCWALDLILGKS